MLGWNDDEASAFPLHDSTDAKVSHVHVAVISEVIGLPVVVLAAFFNFLGVESALCRCFPAPLSQVDDMVGVEHNIHEVPGGL